MKTLFNFKFSIFCHTVQKNNEKLCFFPREKLFLTFINILPAGAAASAVGHGQASWKRGARAELGAPELGARTRCPGALPGSRQGCAGRGGSPMGMSRTGGCTSSWKTHRWRYRGRSLGFEGLPGSLRLLGWRRATPAHGLGRGHRPRAPPPPLSLAPPPPLSLAPSQGRSAAPASPRGPAHPHHYPRANPAHPAGTAPCCDPAHPMTTT